MESTLSDAIPAPSRTLPTTPTPSLHRITTATLEDPLDREVPTPATHITAALCRLEPRGRFAQLTVNR